MRYVSTRGGIEPQSFKNAVLMGMADDGGLLVPERIPDVSGRLDDWRGLDFVRLAQAVVSLFVDDIPPSTLNGLIADAYESFDHTEIAPVVNVGDVQVLELFHGPTLAFKDIALQLLGRLFEHVLAESDQHLNIIGATSGDTGSAAIAGVRGQRNVDIFVMFPKGRVSPLQERQMTTVLDDNVHCIAVEGSFDDCQSMMKTVFADVAFKQRHKLGAVNSVNWARVLAQIVYYGYASLKAPGSTSFCVPTGNFGNVFAGYIAKRMGFPIRRLLLATNENDILARFFRSGRYARSDVRYTITPAMDIQVASNFERFLYYHFDEDAVRLSQFMTTFARDGAASLDAPPDTADFLATAVSAEETVAAIKSTFEQCGYVADPHTAVGLAAAARFSDELPVTCVATAHPAKFPESVDAALGRPGLATHPALDALKSLPTRCADLPADVDALKAFVGRKARS